MPDWTSGRPAYQQVADELRREIRNLNEGDQLPSYAAIMDRFAVSVTVARAAVAQLRTEGLVATHQGKGAFVLPNAGQVNARDAELDDLRAGLAALTERVAALEARNAVRPKRGAK